MLDARLLLRLSNHLNDVVNLLSAGVSSSHRWLGWIGD